MAQVHNAESQPLTDQAEHGRGLAPYQHRSTLSADEGDFTPKPRYLYEEATSAHRHAEARGLIP